MNSTKSNLIKASAIFALISGVGNVLSAIFDLCDIGYVGETLTGFGSFDGELVRLIVIWVSIIELVLGLCSFVGGILLLKSRSQKVSNSSGLYKGGCALVIVGGLGLGLQSILLYIAFASNGQRFEPEFNDGYLNENSTSINQHPCDYKMCNVEEQIKLLRDMKQRGEISDDEFKKEMFDIIKNQK